MQKQIQMVPTVKLNFYWLNDQKFLVVTKKSHSFYAAIPRDFQCFKNRNILILQTGLLNVKTNNILFYSFGGFLVNWFKRIEKPFIKKLFLKGLGLKAIINSVTNQIELKLGFSHVFKILIPANMNILVKRNTLRFESSDLLLLGKFLYEIRNLKYPNPYKGKGIWYKSEHKTLKTVKKT